MKSGRICSLFVLGSLFSLLLAGCSSGANSGGSGGGGTPPVTPSITSVAVSCNATTVPTTQTTQCAATVSGTGSYSSAVTWSVNTVAGGNSTVGRVSSTGIYTAPAIVPTPFTTTITATSVADATKTGSVPIIVAGTIATASQAISAASGGTITLPDGSSVTIDPGTMSADATVTLSKVSVASSQPSNPAIESVGPALVLNFSSPAHFLFRTDSGQRLATFGVRPRGAFSSGLHFVINVAGNISASLTHSVPMASLISSANGVATNFVGAVGAFDATAQTVTGDISGYALHAASAGAGFVSSVEVTAQNFVLAKLQTYVPQNSLALNIVPSNPLADTWVSYAGCPTGKTLLVVHGMNSSVTGTYPTADSTIQNIREAGGYDGVVGYDYDWTNAIDASGAYVAAFLNTLAQCPAVASIDVEAHSEGVAVTLSALTDVTASTRQKIKRVVAVAGPIMGTPMANTADLAGYLASQSSVVMASGLASEGMAYVLSQPFVHDLVVSVPGDNSKLDIIRRTVSPYSIGNAPQIFVVAGDAPGSMQLFADMMSFNGVNYSDGFIPLSSALAFQNNSSNLPVLKVYPLPPFPGNHTQLIGNSSLVGPSVAHAVGAQISTSATSPTLSLSSVPACTNSIVCSGMAGTYFSLSGSGLTNNDTYTLYQQDDTGNVSTPPQAASFIASNAAVPPNTWQDTTACGVGPRTLVLFAQDTTSGSLLASNAVTEQVVAGTCIAPNPAPSIGSLSPPSLPAGSSTHTLTISGTGFVSGSTVTFNGISHTPTFISSSQLTISLTASDIATAGLFSVVVTNPAPGGGSSNSVNFITSGTSTITISPTSVSLAESGSQIFTATLPSGGYVKSWSVDSGTTVVIDLNTIKTIKYFAANTPGTFHLVATSSVDPSQSATATITITGPSPNANEWTWVGGPNTPNGPAVYGIQGVASATNIPGARDSAVTWTDYSGNFWLFGGEQASGGTPDTNDLWKFNPSTAEWTWVSGNNTTGSTGSYGTKGVSSGTNVPPARGDGAASWIDQSGNLWLFGGYGDMGELNDLWEFNPDSKEWTWIGGSNTAGATSVYGTQGVAAAGNVPGARDAAAGSTDSAGNFWLFGGGSTNDLWKFNPTTRLWTWIGGNTSSGVYGTLGVASSTNIPGARSGSAAWTDHSGNFWLFGGHSYIGGFLNDLWEFNPGTKEWTWVSGSNHTNGSGVYGTKGVPSLNNVPENTTGAISWIDGSGSLWLFGGSGISGGNHVDRNDLWKFNPATNEWTWMGGINPITCTAPTTGGSPGICGPAGVYGTQGVPAASNLPSSRMGAVGWIDSNANLWMFGGLNIDPSGTYNELNDLWRYQP